MKRSINGKTWQGDAQALDALENLMAEQKTRRESVRVEDLNMALKAITDYLETGWCTVGGRRLRQFVWSLWNDHHLINLFDLSSGLGSRLSDAVIVVFRAAMVGALKEEHKRTLLERSGEFARWNAACEKTPENEQVLYPPLAIGTDALRRLARSAEQADNRLVQERRAEQAQAARHERGIGV